MYVQTDFKRATNPFVTPVTKVAEVQGESFTGPILQLIACQCTQLMRMHGA